MFFGTKAKDEEIVQLKNKIEELKQQLDNANTQVKSQIDYTERKNANEISELKKQNEQLKSIASFTTEEAIIAIDKNNKIIFSNEKATQNIKI